MQSNVFGTYIAGREEYGKKKLKFLFTDTSGKCIYSDRPPPKKKLPRALQMFRSPPYKVTKSLKNVHTYCLT